MGMKMKPEMPPQIDTSVTDRTAEKEAALEKERQRMKSRDALILFAVVAFGMAVMVGLIFYLI